MYMNQVRLLVADYARSFDFYSTVLGLRLVFGDQTSGYAEFLAGDDVSALALMDRQFLEVVLHGKGSGHADAFNLSFTVNSVDAVYEELSGKGLEFVASPTTREEMGGRTAHLRDPDGNLIELYEMIDRATS